MCVCVCVCVCVGVYKLCERVYMVNMVWEEVRNISYTTGKHYFKKTVIQIYCTNLTVHYSRYYN